MKEHKLEKMMTVIIERPYNGEFKIFKDIDSGEFFAISEYDPGFCLVTDSIEKTFKAGIDALNMHGDYKAKEINDEKPF